VTIRVTHLTTATAIIEIDGLRLLTDPALDPPGQRYSFRFGLSSKKTEAPALPPGGIGPIDAVLVSHDHHADNLDAAGRALLPGAKRVLTTVSGARRLGGNATGLAPWASTELVSPGGLRVKVTATPARHGPPGVTLVEWETTGFLLEWEGQEKGGLYISGDTVWFGGIEEIARRAKVSVALLHVGGVRFGLTGPILYTFDGPQAARAAIALGARTVVPLHYDGWEHFRETRAGCEGAFAAAGIADRVRWLTKGEATEVPV
jgi:L-ascorbate metabolism protein UlaG (beta-lactamase superfamily)